VHDVQRRATSDFVGALHRATAPPEVVGDLRDFLVASLTHHHEREDHALWPILVSSSPGLRGALAALTREHERLEVALAALHGLPVLDGDAEPAREAAIVLRDLVHEHLAHEEPVLFPALRDHLSEEAWDAFSRATVESAPQPGIHLLVAYLEVLGSPAEVDLVFRHLSDEKRAGLPALRELGRSALVALDPAVATSARTAR
jgi:hypothetical protein